jgi:ubiquinone/menaquinone biosynthesis C-methylase UbiE
VLLQGVLHGRRRRSLVLGAVAAAWLVAAIGAFTESRAVLGVGLLLAGVASLSMLKLQMESGTRGPHWSSRGGAVPSNSAPNDPAGGRLELYSDHAIGNRPDLVATVRQALIEHHFSKLTLWTDETGPEYFRVDLDRHTYMRHDAAVTYIVPWVNQVIPLAGTSIIEIGCGTGSSTAAFAPFAGVVYGYDISTSSINAAKVRLEAHGLADRAELIVSRPAELLATVEARHASEPVDIVLLYALLEHQTVDERIETLRLAQRVLKPGGAIVVTETPNRLTYFDRHTSQLPFFHLLPVDLQLLYADRSPRATFADGIATHRKRQPGDEVLRELMIRWGQSVSFHDFEVAIGDVNERILASGLHPNLMKLRPERPEEKPLRDFVRSVDLSIHPGFTRYYLDLIIAV